MTDVTGEPIVIVKTDPEDGKALQEQHDDITPRTTWTNRTGSP
ncbi:MmcQ/YjbR family DNA-binding protein [Arthrobacter sp. STN4]|nr:MmcQ/YjbR family DNA-binding protein [Arthrobacter sp. STN4]